MKRKKEKWEKVVKDEKNENDEMEKGGGGLNTKCWCKWEVLEEEKGR